MNSNRSGIVMEEIHDVTEEAGAPDLPLTQSEYLNDLMSRQVEVCVYLVNGIKLQGFIKSHEQYALFFSSTSNATQLVYKHAISTVVPVSQRPR